MSLSSYFAQLKQTACNIPLLGILVRAGLRGSKGNIKDSAAGIAYFCFLSLFPLILGLIALASSVLKSERLRQLVLVWIEEFFPVGSDYVMQNIESMVRLRGAASLASVVVLFWSAKKMVGAISRGINSTLEQKRDYAVVLSPLRNFGLVVVITVLMFTTIAISPLADVISTLELDFLGQGWRNFINLIGGHAVSAVSTGAMIACTYFLTPYHRPTWKETWRGLLTATILVELGKKVFVLYVDNSSSLSAIYGSISTTIVLMLWLYFFARVLLFGAEVNFVYNHQNENQDVEQSESTI
jgi:membrane protein